MNELQRFLAAQPAIDAVQVFITDASGVPRGKCVKASELEAIYRDGRRVAGSILGLDITGEDNIWKVRPAVFVFNHQSQLDVPILGALMRRDFTGVAKKELAKDPTFAAIGWLTEIAYVDRTDVVAAKKALEPAIDRIRAGKSLVIAPEGTRSPTPKLLPFKKGAFHLAMQAGVPMVPVVIRNAGEIMAAHSLLVNAGTVQVAVLPPVDTTRWTVKTLDKQVARVRQMFLDTLAD